MGRAMALPGANPVLKENPKLTVRKGPYTYTVETHGEESTYSVSDGTRTISVPIHWNFGGRRTDLGPGVARDGGTRAR